SVEMPAPVKPTMQRASAIMALSSSTLAISAPPCGPRHRRLGRGRLSPPRRYCSTERLEQRAVHRVLLGIVFRMPLHAQGEARSVGDADGLDGAVIGHPLHHDPAARFEDALAVKGIDADGLGAEQARESS